ncbi:MAG: cytochrome c3 family protein [Thermoanaerobaculales bacterium]|nr:cytochrome c3 family protein [Thermoanaerobaculales bacterium]
MKVILRAVLVIGVMTSTMPGFAQQAGVAGTVHNLSVSGPGEVRSQTEREICKFCHIPHNPVVPQPLWGHRLSKVSQYRTSEMEAGHGGRVMSPQPDGASRLCLSCHDGTVALGNVASERAPITMVGTQVLSRGRPGFIGTDLSGSHPVSFVMPDNLADDGGRDMALRSRVVIDADPDVHLDAQGKMQCTTCHDPHSDVYFRPDGVPHFWVKSSVDEVCLTCHELR